MLRFLLVLLLIATDESRFVQSNPHQSASMEADRSRLLCQVASETKGEEPEDTELGRALGAEL